MVDYNIKLGKKKLMISRKKGKLKPKKSYNEENTQTNLEDY